ncbi:MAG: hypothetical protein KDA89_12810 [Planctomycetaceae bacterium]|nr:hypothetical protein [Planctomycetaceae bacterium]
MSGTVPAQFCLLSEMHRLRVTGGDRGAFLHNFCTNSVTGLKPGQHREGFFTDVRARILAHGYVAAGDEEYQIVMLGGDEAALQKHLSRYVITEDVAVSSESFPEKTVAVFGPDALRIAGIVVKTDSSSAPISGTCGRGQDVFFLSTEWNNTPLIFFFPETSDSASHLQQQLTENGAVATDRSAFDRLRIPERFPIVGQDVTDDHLAPEAGRNRQAISYTKGCYLGQEPIARIDAMGHVNRSLRFAEARVVPESSGTDSSATAPSGEVLPLVTSAVQCEEDGVLEVLIVLAEKARTSGEPVFARLADGKTVSLTDFR